MASVNVAQENGTQVYNMSILAQKTMYNRMPIRSSVISSLNNIKFALQVLTYQGGLHTRFKVYINIIAPDIQSDYAFAFYCRFLQVCMQKKENEVTFEDLPSNLAHI